MLNKSLHLKSIALISTLSSKLQMNDTAYSTWSSETLENTSEMLESSSEIMESTDATIFNFINISCYGNQTAKSDFIYNKSVQCFLYVLYASIFILGIFGNSLVCYVVFQNKAMQTVTNLFITNLALSDILLCALAVPFTPLYTFLKRWIFGVPLCHIVPFAQGCSVYISTLTLTSIAVDRFFVIIYPFHPRMKLSTCFAIVICIWIFSLIITSPYGLFMHVIVEQDTYYCEEHWPSEKARKLFSTSTTTLQFLLPFLVIAFCYICVSLKLNDRAKAKPGKKSSKRDEIDRDRKRRTHKMLVAMVLVFLISWLPLNIVNIMNDFDDRINCWEYYNILFFIAHLTAMSSTCYNPFLYAWLNDNFRKEFIQVLPCLIPLKRSNSTNSRLKAYREERTFNGFTETTQEPSPSAFSKPSGYEKRSLSPITEIALQNSDDILVPNTESGDSISLGEILNAQNILPPLVPQISRILPSGVLETPFDYFTPDINNPSSQKNENMGKPLTPTTVSSNSTAVFNLSTDTEDTTIMSHIF